MLSHLKCFKSTFSSPRSMLEFLCDSFMGSIVLELSLGNSASEPVSVGKRKLLCFLLRSVSTSVSLAAEGERT